MPNLDPYPYLGDTPTRDLAGLPLPLQFPSSINTLMSTLSVYAPQQSLSSCYSTFAPFFALALTRLECMP